MDNKFSESCVVFVKNKVLNKIIDYLPKYYYINREETSFTFKPICTRYYLSSKGQFLCNVEDGFVTFNYITNYDFTVRLLIEYKGYFNNLLDPVISYDENKFEVKVQHAFEPIEDSIEKVSHFIVNTVKTIEEIFSSISERFYMELKYRQEAFQLRSINNFLREKEGNDLSLQFNDVYELKCWNDGWGSGSGSGSRADLTSGYRVFLQEFFKNYKIKSIVDVGCGDWQFSKMLDLSGIKYIGYDVVSQVIESNKQKYENENIKFVLYKGNFDELPAADLLICKDVLQHLPNSYIYRFISNLKKFKYCLIANSKNTDPAKNNYDIAVPGDGRCLDLLREPFNLKAKKVFEISLKEYNISNIVIEVLLVDNTTEV